MSIEVHHVDDIFSALQDLNKASTNALASWTTESAAALKVADAKARKIIEMVKPTMPPEEEVTIKYGDSDHANPGYYITTDSDSWQLLENCTWVLANSPVKTWPTLLDAAIALQKAEQRRPR